MLESVSARDDDALAGAHTQTLAALRDGAGVVYQAAFATDEFVGFADFLVRTDDGAYEVYDTKLARRAKITALLQLAAYADQLERLGIPTGPRVHLLLGDGSTSTHRLTDIAPVFADRWARLRWMIAERVAAAEAIAWEEPGYAVCGRCAECAAQVEATRDVLLVAGMRSTQRIRLAEAGIRTIDQLAATDEPVAGIGAGALAALRDQARMQVAGEGARSPRACTTPPASPPCPNPTRATSSSTSRATRSGPTAAAGRPAGTWSTCSASSSTRAASASTSGRSGRTTARRRSAPPSTS
ncbi:hypothetical protein GCM10025881_34750 [Pseudolysinimonas kribbensis]|uniref:PD-(D/E)XK endonuclease-like domain-containing protein n=1 Tax=Pseudolysinimonas kribbensis TaxID=433641 RepID=A0ABQ6KEB0_9MICO|nr:hypothetical protein GCM10025881_34750 [Pseudolysinimonas kribbensis]